MAKKEKFSVDGSALFGESAKIGRPKNDALVRQSTAQKGLTPDLTRQTLIVKIDQIEILKNYAYTERKKLKGVVMEAFSEYIEKHVDSEHLLTRPDDWR